MSQTTDHNQSTQENQSQKKLLILHPILTAIFPILAFYTANIDQVGSKVIWRPMIVSIVVALFLWGVLWLILRNPLKSGLLSTWMLITFFTYGHVRNLVLGVIPVIGRHRFLFPLWILITFIGVWLILKKLRFIYAMNMFLNIFGIAMIIILLIQDGHNGVGSEQAMKRQMQATIPLTMPENPPDIYYIILDAYARSDVLRDIYDFDNTSFLDQLREMGFFVADCSLANYPSTELSLASSLNMSYHDDPDNGEENLVDLIKHNRLWSSLQSIGYQTVAFETEFDAINITNSDIYFPKPTNNGFNKFEFMLSRTTLMIFIWDEIPYDPTGIFSKLIKDWGDPFLTRKAEVDRSILDRLSKIPDISGPKISYAHLTITHPPYVSEKEAILRYNKKAYVSQIEYVNHEILETIQEIISKSLTKPVIIIQADHGPFPSNPSEIQLDYIRMPILNAYMLPAQFSAKLYPEITPVNSFRLVLDALFNGNLGLIEDRSIYYDEKGYRDTWENCR